jgi:hypothetical protein
MLSELERNNNNSKSATTAADNRHISQLLNLKRTISSTSAVRNTNRPKAKVASVTGDPKS